MKNLPILFVLGSLGVGGCVALPPDKADALKDPYAIARATAISSDAPVTVINGPAPAGAGLWVAHRGETARAMVERWSATSGYQVHWDTKENPPIQADATLFGNYRVVVLVALSEGFPNLVPKLKPHFWDGDRQLVVSEEGQD